MGQKLTTSGVEATEGQELLLILLRTSPNDGLATIINHMLHFFVEYAHLQS